MKTNWSTLYTELSLQLKSGRAPEVARRSSAALKKVPKSRPFWDLLGAASIQTADFNTAVNAFRNSAKLDPENANSHLNLAHALESAGQAEDAVLVLEELTAKEPKLAVASYRLGMQLARLKRFPAALERLETAKNLDPKNPEILNDLGLLQKTIGNSERARQALTAAVTADSKFFQAHNNLGNLEKEESNWTEALAHYQNANRLAPQDPSVSNNLGLAYSALGYLDEAITTLKAAILVSSRSAHLYSNLGRVLHKAGQDLDAIEALQKAIQINPHIDDAYNNLGLIFLSKENWAVAGDWLLKGLKINSRSPALLVNYATVLKKTNRFDEALAAYSKALEIQPDSADFYFNAIDTCERYNKIGKAKELLSSAKSVLTPLPDDLLLTESRLLVREKRHTEALLVLDKLNFSSARSEVSIEALQIKGTCEEKVGLYKQAFSTFSAMNALTMKSERYAECDPEAYFDSAASDLVALRDYDPQRNSSRLQKPSPRLAFLIGFPRSGTTLTDTILLAHPQIKIAEEGPAIASAKAYFDSLGAFNFLHRHPGQTELELGRAKYLETLHSIMEPTDNDVVIDKMPLNILRIPLITALFPTAPLIVVVRHPLDSIFSCWTQNFSLNDAMANMVSLDKICALYDVCMETLMVAAEKLQPNIVLIKYETLLSDVKGEVAPALDALGLAWDENMEDHTAAARDRGFISTPSYSQVSQPLYMHAKNKWLNYKEELEDFRPAVEKWVKHFGYDT